MKSFYRHQILRTIRNQQTGFTLIEALAALAVFTIGIVAAFTYALSNQESVRDNFDRYLSTSLGREGIEMIRNVRDSNWLKIDNNLDCNISSAGIQPCSWDQNLSDGFYIVDYNYDADDAPLASDNNFFGDSKRIYIDNTDNGFYSHNSLGGPATNIFRTMEIRSICLNNVSGVESISLVGCNLVNEQKIGIQVIAHMGWQRAGRFKNLDLVDNLYNWRE